MKHSLSDLDNDCGLQDLNVIYDTIPDFDEEGIISSYFILWQPLYDLYIVADEIVVTIEIAGVAKKDFSLYAGKHHMVIDGVRKSTTTTSKEKCTFHNVEISYGRFSRLIEFPIPVEPKRYRYKLENGILTLRFPILQERTIHIEEE